MRRVRAGGCKSVGLFGAIVHVTIERSLNQSVRLTYSRISNIRPVVIDFSTVFLSIGLANRLGRELEAVSPSSGARGIPPPYPVLARRNISAKAKPKRSSRGGSDERTGRTISAFRARRLSILARQGLADAA